MFALKSVENNTVWIYKKHWTGNVKSTVSVAMRYALYIALYAYRHSTTILSVVIVIRWHVKSKPPHACSLRRIHHTTMRANHRNAHAHKNEHILQFVNPAFLHFVHLNNWVSLAISKCHKDLPPADLMDIKSPKKFLVIISFWRIDTKRPTHLLQWANCTNGPIVINLTQFALDWSATQGEILQILGM